MVAHRKQSMKSIKEIIASLIPLLAMLLAKITWNYEINSRSAIKVFSSKIDIMKFLKMYYVGGEETYHQQVVNNAKREYFNPIIEVMGGKISYFALFVFLCMLLVLIVMYLNIERTIFINIILFVVSVRLYVFFIGAIYTYRFSEYEALKLASYTRYMNIPFLALSLYAITGGYYCISYKKNAGVQEAETKCMDVYSTVKDTNPLAIIILCVCLMLPQMLDFHSAVCGYTKIYANNFRSNYNELLSLIRNNCNNDDKVWCLSRGDSGLDYLVLRFSARPIWIQNSGGAWNLGTPVNDENAYLSLSVEEWVDRLEKDGYTYVALYHAGDDFAENFGAAFEDPTTITDNSLFRFDATKKMLIQCKE